MQPERCASLAERFRVDQVSCLLQKALPPDTFSFACQKRTRKAPATFEAREAAGCGSLRLLRALDGTRILQAAAPTAPPCFGHWPRSSPLQTKGCSPLVTPKQKGSIQKIQVAPLEDFLCYADLQSLRDGDTPTAANAVCRYGLSRENAMPGGPQTARHCSIINNSSAEYATATTAACGRSREELLGPWPAGCKARSRAVAAAGCHNSSRAQRRVF